MKMITVKFNTTGRFVIRNRLEDADDLGRDLGDRIGKHGIKEPIEFTEGELRYLVSIVESMDRPQTNGWLNTKQRLRCALRGDGQ